MKWDIFKNKEQEIMMKKEKDNILLEDYTRLKKIGDGGYATVYKVRHNELEYIRAIRVLKDDVENEDDPIYQKFINECKILLRLGNGNHPNIVHIYQPLFKANKAFVEMDYITGENISEYVERVKFIPIDEIIKFVKEIGSALAYCHVDIYKYCYDRELDNLQDDPEDGSKPLIDDKKRKELIKKYRVIHNDIHSGNIMRRDDGHYILLDFGLSIQEGNLVRKSQRTNGAPEYKSPEKWENDADVSTQSDIYSFGVVLYEMLTGHVPFIFNKVTSEMKALNEMMNAHKFTIPKSVVDARRKCFNLYKIGKQYHNDIPDWLIQVVDRCLAKKPEKRFKDGKILINFIDTQTSKNSYKDDDKDDDRDNHQNNDDEFVLLKQRNYQEAIKVFAKKANSNMISVCKRLIALEQQKRNGTISKIQQKRLNKLYRDYNIEQY